MIMIHFADVVFCKILTQISLDFRNHQSSNWFNNFVILPPFSNDLDKKHLKNILFDFCYDRNMLAVPNCSKPEICSRVLLACSLLHCLITHILSLHMGESVLALEPACQPTPFFLKTVVPTIPFIQALGGLPCSQIQNQANKSDWNPKLVLWDGNNE